MKKMLSTTLVAIAFAMVSTVDAKVMARRGAAKTTAAESVRENTQEVLANPTQANVAQTVEMLANDKAGVAIAEKKAKELEVANQRELVVSLGKKGWFFDSRTAEQVQAHKDASAKLATLEQELKDIKVDNESVKKEVGISYYNAMIGAFITAMAVAGISIIDDIAYKGQGKAMVAPYAKSIYETGKGAVVSGATTARKTYRKYAPAMLGGKTTTVKPAYNP